MSVRHHLAWSAVLQRVHACPLWRDSRSSPRANITLSGKKRWKLLKQLQHMQKEVMEGRTFKDQLSFLKEAYTRCARSLVELSSVSRSVEVAAPPKKKQEVPSTSSKKKRKAAVMAAQDDVEMADME